MHLRPRRHAGRVAGRPSGLKAWFEGKIHVARVMTRLPEEGSDIVLSCVPRYKVHSCAVPGQTYRSCAASEVVAALRQL